MNNETKEGRFNYTDLPSENARKRGRIAGGLVFVLAGALLLGREMGMEVPGWILSWKMALIAFGLVSGIKHGFQRVFWLIPVIVGSAYLLFDFFPEVINRAFIWPVAIIILGLFIIFKPFRKQKFRTTHFKDEPEITNSIFRETQAAPTSFSKGNISISAIMSGVEKNVVDKNFSGGEINAIMGGVEISFAEADILSVAQLEVNAILGGIKMIVPSHWEIKSELNCIMGGIEDKRVIQSAPEGPQKKLLILEGNVCLGGIEIRNY
jgi:predicted membrane protein